jgi:hypothetical protein
MLAVLDHLDEERALSTGQVVLRADPREHAVYQAQADPSARHEGAHLREDRSGERSAA